MKTDSSTPSSLLKRNSGGGTLFLLIAFIAFLLILLIQADLVLISFRSLFTAIALVISAPEAYLEIFTIEILEFWIAAIYLIAVLIGLGIIARQ